MGLGSKRLGYTFKDLYESSLDHEVLMEGLQYSHLAKVVLKHMIQKFGNLLLGKFCQTSSDHNPTYPKEYIEFIHKNDISNNPEFGKTMKFFGYHYVLTKKFSDNDKNYLKIPPNYGDVYISTYEGTYPTVVKREELPPILYHVTSKSNLENIKKFGLLPKVSKTSFNHPGNRIYLFATIDPKNDLPKLIKSIATNTNIPVNEYTILQIVNYNPIGEKFFCDPSLDIGYISDTCRGIFVHRGISPQYIMFP